MSKKNISFNKHLSLNSLLISIRALSIIGLVLVALLTVVYAVQSTRAITEIHSDNIELLTENSKVVTYLSRINQMRTDEVKNLILEIPNPLVLSGIYVILPTCIMFISFFFLIYASILLFYYTAGVNNRKQLLDKKKYNMLQTIRTLVLIALGIVIVMERSVAYFAAGLAIFVLFEFALYMYDSVISLEEKVNKKD